MRIGEIANGLQLLFTQVLTNSTHFFKAIAATSIEIAKTCCKYVLPIGALFSLIDIGCTWMIEDSFIAKLKDEITQKRELLERLREIKN